MAKKIGEILLKANLITNDQLQQALQEQKRSGERLGSLLVKMGFLAEEDILSCLSKQFGVPAIDLETFQIEGSVLETIPINTAKKYTVIPISRVGGTIRPRRWIRSPSQATTPPSSPAASRASRSGISRWSAAWISPA